MRKLKALSVITSMAMTGSMILSAIPFAVSAAPTNPLGYKLTCDTTTFKADELAAGGKTVTVYVDPVGTVTEADKVGSVQFKIKSDSWGQVDPINLILSDDNAIGTDYGNHVKKDKPYNGAGTQILSLWDDTAKPEKAGFSILDYKDTKDFTAYADEFLPAVLIMSDSSCGYMRTDASFGKHIAEFQVKLPADLKSGSYSLSIVEAKSMIVGSKFGADDSVLVDAPTTEGLTFTVTANTDNPDNPVTTTTTSNADVTTTTTTVSDNTSAATTITSGKTPVSTTTVSGDPIKNRIYDGDAYLTVGEAKAEDDGTAQIPVYFKFDDKVARKDIAGIAFQVVYNNEALELTRITEPDESGFSEGGFNQNPKTGRFIYNFTTKDITVDPEKPICILNFKVKEGAADGKYEISLINHLFGADVPLQIVHVQEPGQETTYLNPIVTAGTVTVGNGGEEDILWGDANLDGKVNVRDAAYIAKLLAKGQGESLPINADYNRDEKKNVRDAAAIAKDLAKGLIKNN